MYKWYKWYYRPKVWCISFSTNACTIQCFAICICTCTFVLGWCNTLYKCRHFVQICTFVFVLSTNLYLYINTCTLVHRKFVELYICTLILVHLYFGAIPPGGDCTKVQFSTSLKLYSSDDLYSIIWIHFLNWRSFIYWYSLIVHTYVSIKSIN